MTDSEDAAAADGDTDLLARVLDAAVGELSPAERQQLAADLAARPDSAKLLARQDRLGAALAVVTSHPQLGELQPRDSWRSQTLHKAKIEAAKLRKQRQSQNLPVARPPMSHRQLAGKTTQSVSADEVDPFGTGVPAPPAIGGFGGTPAKLPGVRRLFLAVALTATAGVLVLAFVAARILHHWQAGTAATKTPPPPTSANPGGTTAVTPLSPRELLLLKRDYPDLGQILDTIATEVRFELGGPVAGKGWVGHPSTGPCELFTLQSPPRWDRIDLEGDLTTAELNFIPEIVGDLALTVAPDPQAGPGWKLILSKNGAQVQVFDIPAPAGGPPRALAIERVKLNSGEEQLRFLAVAGSVTPPADGGKAHTWEVLSERLLPVPCPPGHWQLSLPGGAGLNTLQYLLQARLERAKLAGEVPADDPH